ncbi:Diacylglycerol kinase [bioreactor metagenome]|uniref:Diacylglycerol kinase n=1 Tax=bioreactor metagenome TaxID=1076179 RepID=A0A645DLY7_9ZZZZ|nr:diacylglycerol kinase family protein [Erysipelotrichaceae bacterium]
MKVLFVFNPLSGVVQIRNQLLNIINCFSKAGYDLTVYATQAQNDAFRLISQKAAEYELIVCSGGDGTLNEVVNGLLVSQAHVLLGYIPSGSTNDYAASLKLPKNMFKAAELITEGRPAVYDMGLFNERYFVYVAAFGAFTSVSYNTPQETKNLIGHLAYVFEGIKSVGSIKEYMMEVITEGATYYEPFIYGMVTNSLSVGGLYNMSRSNVELDDGLFEVMLIKSPKTAFDLTSITSYLLGIDASSPFVEVFKTRSIRFITDEAIPWTIDGEYGGTLKTAEITVLNKAVQIISKEKVN